MSTRSSRVQEQSDKYPFKSQYKEGYVNAGNYLTELIFQKRSQHFNSGKEPERFWVTGNRLHGAYKGQVIQANRLLKKYDVRAVSAALKEPDAKFIFKLQDKKLIPIIERCQQHVKDVEFVEAEEPREVSESFGKKKRNLFGEL